MPMSNNWKNYPSGLPVGRPSGTPQPNSLDYDRFLAHCRKNYLCTVPKCHRPHYPFCSYHEHFYQHAGHEAYEFYLRIHLNCCAFCGVPIDRLLGVACDIHRAEFLRRVRQLIARNTKAKPRSLILKEWLWVRNGPPIHARAWEWPYETR